MKPAPFTYHAPTTIDDALALLARHGDGAKLLAGGQSLVPMMNLRMARPAHLVDIMRIGGLAAIDAAVDHIAIGALARHADIEASSLLRETLPILPSIAQTIAHYAIRTQGTLGGSLAHADPAAQWPLAAVALGATLVLRGPRGERLVAARDFFLGTMTTALAADEMLIAVRWPRLPASVGWGFEHFARRRGDFALCAVVGLVEARAGCITRLDVTIGGVTPVPTTISSGLHEFVGSAIEPVLAERIGQRAGTLITPDDDAKTAGWYRVELVQALVQRAVATAITRCGAPG